MIQNAIDAISSGETIFFKNAVYEVGVELEWTTDRVSLVGESLATEIRATVDMSSVCNFTGARYAYFNNLFINGYNHADVGLNGKRATSAVPVHKIEHCACWGAKTANIDLTGCEDSTLNDVWLDGRIANDTATAYSNYGLKIGETGDDYRTGGHIKCFDVKSGFHKLADAWLKNIANISFFGS